MLLQLKGRTNEGCETRIQLVNKSSISFEISYKTQNKHKQQKLLSFFRTPQDRSESTKLLQDMPRDPHASKISSYTRTITASCVEQARTARGYYKINVTAIQALAGSKSALSIVNSENCFRFHVHYPKSLVIFFVNWTSDMTVYNSPMLWQNDGGGLSQRATTHSSVNGRSWRLTFEKKKKSFSENSNEDGLWFTRRTRRLGWLAASPHSPDSAALPAHQRCGNCKETRQKRAYEWHNLEVVGEKS
jgi:hypothetical protein